MPIDVQVCMSQHAAAREGVGPVPCKTWHKASGMLQQWRRFTAVLVGTLPICGFCGRGGLKIRVNSHQHEPIPLCGSCEPRPAFLPGIEFIDNKVCS